MKVEFKNKRNKILRGILHKPKKSNDIGIIFTHGFKLTKSGPNFIFRDLEKDFLKKGYTCLRYDRAHAGESEGNKNYFSLIESCGDLDSAVKYINMKKIILVGHSFGGTLSIIHAAKNKSIKKLILLSPSFDFHMPGYKFKKHLKKAVRITHVQMLKMAAKYLVERNHYNVKMDLNNLKIPILIFYDLKDKIIDYSNIDEFIKGKKNIKAIKIEGIGHFFKVKKREVINEVLKWI